MAGIEHIVVHSKSYLVRWIQVAEHQTISWSLLPSKKSINFGIFKHPGTKNGLTPNLPSQETVESSAGGNVPGTPGLDIERQQQTRRASVAEGNVVDKLEGIGLKSVSWQGRCEAERVTMGKYDVLDGQGGTYGLVFDNTFSKQTSKNVMFVLMTHPTNAPPKSGHHLHYSQAFANGSSSSVGTGKRRSPSLRPKATESNESLPSHLHHATLDDPRPRSKSGHGIETKGVEGTTFYTGLLWKKRRRKAQGFAKRFFSLDYTSSTLSYYRNRHSSALRGAIPLSLAAVGVSEKNREFSVDSGAEVWHLKASNRKEFDGWRAALEKVSGTANWSTPITPAQALGDFPMPGGANPSEQREWQRVEELISKVAGTRDAVRGLAKDTDPKYLTGSFGAGLGLTTSNTSSGNQSPTSHDPNSYFPPDADERIPGQSKRPFWKRAASVERSPSALFRRSVSAQLAVPSPALAGTPNSPASGSLSIPKRPSVTPQATIPESDVHERCLALLRDLNSVVTDFSALLAESKARRQPPLMTAESRMSLESIDNQEFFDADDGDSNSSQLLSIRRSSELQDARHEEQLFEDASEADSDTSSDAGDARGESVIFTADGKTSQSPLFPSLPSSLPPLPHAVVSRRSTVSAPKQSPPSFIGFLRKNAGKDLSTISMPVTANEPTSLLQRLAESIEYPQLLDAAASSSITAAERLMYVTAFAVSYYSNNRVKERAIRKPFNPMLGETFELVREDLGFRFVAEKVSHHPVRMACQAESLNNGGWCYAQSPQPVQKFWGKSVELNNEGRARVVLHGPQEHYSWSQATCFLRNVIAGEKYVEPVQTMTIQNESNGMRAVATFKAGGMFSGRSEEVNIQLFDHDSVLSIGLAGKWTESLKRTDTGATIWTAGAIVPDAAKVYGFTTFAATLNQVTDIEEGHLAPTDSRLRPDQQALEAGDIDKAEALKAKLEERQRARRKVLESHGQQYAPRFFEKVEAGTDGSLDSEEVWMLKRGPSGYWERRAGGDWSGVQEVFEL